MLNHRSRLRIDSDDVVLVPHIGEDKSLGKLELVDVHHALFNRIEDR